MRWVYARAIVGQFAQAHRAGGGPDAAAGVPRYPGIAADLRARISGEEWEPGATMPRLPDLAGGYGSTGTPWPGSGHLEAEGLVWAVPRRGTIVRHGMSRPRRLRGNLVKRNLVTDSPSGRFRQWRRRIPARPGSPRY